jgi:hypothetical protein
MAMYSLIEEVINQNFAREVNMTEPTTAPTAQEIAETIQELEQYRERLVTETMETGKKAKMTKTAVMAQLEPELARIDAGITSLRMQQAAIQASN